MNKSTLIRLAAAVVVPGIVAYKLLWTAVQPKIERRLSKVGLPPNGVAANGPLSGDVSLYEKELAAAKQRTSPGYYPSINGAGLTDSERSRLFSAATFSGSFDVPNKVYAQRNEDDYQASAQINNRRPGELYITGDDFPPGTDTLHGGPGREGREGATRC